MSDTELQQPATPAPRFLLEPEVWLALGMEADAHGGVGRGQFYEDDLPRCPVCLYGLAGALDGLTKRQLSRVVYDGCEAKTPTVAALKAAGIGWDHNDDAVNAARRQYPSLERPERVRWEELAASLGLGIKGVDDVAESE